MPVANPRIKRRLPIGAEVVGEQGVHFRVWGPKRRKVEVVFEQDSNRSFKLTHESDGYFSGICNDARAGDLYRFGLDDGDAQYPDPASRFQPDGPHGPSQIVDDSTFPWTDSQWLGISSHCQVLYEMHVGTFTKEGTWQAAARELGELKEMGITCLEIMPINEFPGRFGWGYDVANQFAPFHHYGTPDDCRHFVDRAHEIGLGVILDLVYNHFGPDGNYLAEFSNSYFNREQKIDWGDPINFDGPDSQPVREFFISNAIYWIVEFHLDGFRYDATQAFFDSSPKHILTEITEAARTVAGKRSLYIVAENEPQHTDLVRTQKDGGSGMDALWNDDFHHSAMVTLTSHNEAYYSGHLGAPQEFISAAKWGYLYQGQHYSWQAKRRGTPAIDLPPVAFVHFLQNHDQIANSARGFRVHQLSSPAAYRAMTGLWLMMPQTPMFFQGQEFATSSPFFYFADHQTTLGKLIGAGRAHELSQFPSIASPKMLRQLQDPCDNATFERSKLDFSERSKAVHAQIYRLHKDLLRLRQSLPGQSHGYQRGQIDGAVLGSDALLLRYFSDGDDWLIVTNFGRDLPLAVSPEPLLAPPADKRWKMILTTEDPLYGGAGAPAPVTEKEGWHLIGRCTSVLKSAPRESAEIKTRIRPMESH